MKYIWIVLIMLLGSYAWAGETDFADYEVEKYYEGLGLVTWISDDKREIHYWPEMKPEDSTYEERYYEEQDYKRLLEERWKNERD